MILNKRDIINITEVLQKYLNSDIFLPKEFVRTANKILINFEEEGSKIIDVLNNKYLLKEKDEEKKNIIKKYANLDKDGNVVIKNGQYDIPEGNINSLKAELEEFEKRMSIILKEVDDYLKEEVNGLKDIYIDFKHLPEEIEPKVYSVLKKIIKEEE